ncbi:hypothetical protein [Streptomyces sp. AC627_RSS907]|uniref:hypothetical protein n=1 Tax=Streptomyces sp. AC627_RSS907 TaxID=2823684 RepID=UPI001C24546C|nr:hypothetical protein [Streptomyces sp. AC627_RSS907]
MRQVSVAGSAARVSAVPVQQQPYGDGGLDAGRRGGAELGGVLRELGPHRTRRGGREAVA